MSWVTILSLLLFANVPLPWIAVPIALYRLVDIIDYQMCNLLIDSQRPNWRVASTKRSLLLALMNLWEIVVSYAIFYLACAAIVRNAPEGGALATAIESLYFSFVTMATLGYGEFVPIDDRARLIVVAHLGTELLFILAILPVLVSNIATQLTGREHRGLDERRFP